MPILFLCTDMAISFTNVLYIDYHDQEALIRFNRLFDYGIFDISSNTNTVHTASIFCIFSTALRS